MGEGCTTEEPTAAVAAHVGSELAERPWIVDLARLGWVAKGAVYGAMAWAALTIALHRRSDTDAEYTGIVPLLVESTLTRALLVLIALGLLLYVAFRMLSIALIDEADPDAWLHRIAYLFSAITYLAISWVCLTAAARGGYDDGPSLVERLSRDLLERPAGRVLLGIGAAVALGVACYFLYKGASRRFVRQCTFERAGPIERRVIEVTGAIGWAGRALIVGAVAGFVLWAALDADPSDDRGLDRSMHRLALSDTGRALVLLTAALLAVYAFYCIASARHRTPAWQDGSPDPSSNGSTS